MMKWFSLIAMVVALNWGATAATGRNSGHGGGRGGGGGSGGVSAYLSAVSTILPVANGSTAVNSTIPYGSSAVLTWDSAGAGSCAGTGFSTGSAISGTVTVSPTITTTYSVNCSGAVASSTVTVSGNLINAATTYCAANGGGSGSSGSPWKATCIQAAVNAAASGDTVYLSAGNWALPMGAGQINVAISTPINLIGAGTGDTFSAAGNPINANSSTPCPTASGNITCVYPTGTRTFGGPGGFISFTGAGCTNASVAHIFFDDSATTAGGTQYGLLSSYPSCVGPILVSDIHVLSYNDSSFTAESQFWTTFTDHLTVQNSIFASPLYQNNSGQPFYSVDGAFQSNINRNLTAQNNSFWEAGLNNIAQDNTIIAGNVFFMGNDGAGHVPGFDSAVGLPGAAIGPSFFGAGQGGVNGSLNYTLKNNYFNAPGVPLGIAGGINDPGGGGGVSGLTVTGNTLKGTIASIDSCELHYYNPSTGLYGTCSPGVRASAASWAANQVTFVVPSTTNIVALTPGLQFATAEFSPSGYNNVGYASPAWTVVSNTCGGGNCTLVAALTTNPGTATTLGFLAPFGGVEGMQIGGTMQSDCTDITAGSANFAITNNSIVATTSAQLMATGGGIINCWLAGHIPTPHNITVYNFNASQNYLASPSNVYLTDINTINPSVANNFGLDVSSGFTTLPTVSFTLGTLSNGAVQIVNPSFTAQYGAVRWIVSTSSTTPTSGDARWSYVPPVSLSSVSHGNTVYMWVMDSANNISPVASALLQ